MTGRAEVLEHAVAKLRAASGGDVTLTGEEAHRVLQALEELEIEGESPHARTGSEPDF